MGVVYENLPVKSDFSQMHPSRSGYGYERGAFHSAEHFARIDRIFGYEHNHYGPVS